MIAFVFNQKELPAPAALSYQLDISKQLIKGHSQRGLALAMGVNDLVEWRDGFFWDVVEHLHLLLFDLFPVVVVDFDKPELFEPWLLLHFALKDSILWGDAGIGPVAEFATVYFLALH